VLLEFRVRNFRSFGEESVLSMVASGDSALEETNTAPTNIESLPRVVRSAVVYGANASGKSNLLRAMNLMRGVVMESVTLQHGQSFNVQPFRLDSALKDEPTLFEITIVMDGIRHQYGFEFTPTRIVAEWLLVYQKVKPQRWFDRRIDSETGKDVFEFSSFLAGQKRGWQEATRPNALFLSTAVQLNSEQLRPLHSWFAESFIVLLEGGHLPFDFSTNMVQTQEGQTAVTTLMGSADIAISSISAVRKKGFAQQFSFGPAVGKADSERKEIDLLVPTFRHQAGEVSADFDYLDESQGTQKLFSLAGPLLDIIRNGKVLVIDELDRSLHPLLVRQIVRTFQDPAQNQRGAQLIFSTHDTTLLDSQFLRRDQVWLTEKRRNQSSELVPLTEFSPRKGEALEKGYLSGRYGGVPVLADHLAAGSGNGKK
jgi:energy-coupling factor transporter ATP-binding protein EcfA2